jgi:hypothetical protein
MMGSGVRVPASASLAASNMAISGHPDVSGTWAAKITERHGKASESADWYTIGTRSQYRVIWWRPRTVGADVEAEPRAYRVVRSPRTADLDAVKTRPTGRKARGSALRSLASWIASIPTGRTPTRLAMRKPAWLRRSGMPDVPRLHVPCLPRCHLGRAPRRSPPDRPRAAQVGGSRNQRDPPWPGTDDGASTSSADAVRDTPGSGHPRPGRWLGRVERATPVGE